MKTLTAILAALAVTVAAAQDEPALTALVGATVHPVSGEPIENGVVLMRGDRIESVGADLQVPDGEPGATIIELCPLPIGATRSIPRGERSSTVASSTSIFSRSSG